MIISLDAAERGEQESLWSLFKRVAGMSAVSWNGLSLMAQLERHYVEREQRLDPHAFADLVALAWMVPGPVGCNVAIQLGQALRGRAGAWIAGIASVLPFFVLMTLFAIFYRAPFVRSLAAPALLLEFSMVLAALIGVTWFRQIRTLVHRPLDWAVAIASTLLLACVRGPGAFVMVLAGAFAAGWISCASIAPDALVGRDSPKRAARADFSVAPRDWRLLIALAILVALFVAPLPLRYEAMLRWPRLAGAGMTLFGGGFSALPVLKTLFVTSSTGVSDHDFMLAFTLSQVSPGPLLNVVPFLGYLTDGWLGALFATVALFVPSGCLVVFAQKYLHRLRREPRFDAGLRMLRAATTAFLAVAVVKLVAKTPLEPAYWLTGAFACLCFARFKMPAYAVYAIVGAGCAGWLLLAAHA